MGSRRQKLTPQISHFLRVWPLWVAVLLMALKSATTQETVELSPPSQPRVDSKAPTRSVLLFTPTPTPLANHSRSAQSAAPAAAVDPPPPAPVDTAPVVAVADTPTVEASAATSAIAAPVAGAVADAAAALAAARSGASAGPRPGTSGRNASALPVATPAPTNAEIENRSSIDFGSYLEAIAGPLGADDLEYGLDYLNERDGNVLQEFDFDPERTAAFLITAAAKHNTTPSAFLADMQDLIYLQNRSRNEARGDKDMSDVITRVVPEPGLLMQSDGYHREVPLRDTWRKELHRLEKKYKIGGNWSDPDAPTPSRILLMFPNFLNLGQKPFSGQTELCSGSDVCLPTFFSYPEFAGLIPLSGNDTVRLGIFTVHLRALHLGREDKTDSLPFRTKCAVAKRRMEKSLISDDRRWRFLENNDVITANGDLTVNMEASLDDIPKEFKERVVLTRAIPTKQRLKNLYSFSAQSRFGPKDVASGPQVIPVPPAVSKDPESKEDDESKEEE